MNKKLALTLFFGLFLLVPICSQTASAAWFNLSWTTRTCFNITNPTGTDLYEYPLHLQLNNSNVDTSGFQAGGVDLRVMSDASASPTELYHCKELWNASGNSFIVTNTTIKADNTTQICLYYNNPTATDSQNCNLTYGSYNVTSIFSDGTGSNVNDVKSRSNGTLQGSYAWKTYPDCKYGSCVSINGNNGDQMNYTTNLPVGWTDGTILLFTKANVALGSGATLRGFLDSGNAIDAGDGIYIFWREATPRLEAQIRDGTVANFQSTIASLDTNWHCVGLTWSTTQGGDMWLDSNKNVTNSTTISAPTGSQKTIISGIFNRDYPLNATWDETLFIRRKLSDVEMKALCGDQITNLALTTENQAGTYSWISPSSNNTLLAINQTSFTWNISTVDNLTSCDIQINGTNQTGSITPDNKACYYSESGYSGNITRCSIGWLNLTTGLIETTQMCINTNEQLTIFDIDWVSPSANNTVLPSNQTYFLWNITTLNYNLTSCNFDINGTNQSGSLTADNRFCVFNETGLTGNQTRCAIAYASNGTAIATTTYVCLNSLEFQVYPPLIELLFGKRKVNDNNWMIDLNLTCLNQTLSNITQKCGNVSVMLQTNYTGSWVNVTQSGSVTVPTGEPNYVCDIMGDTLNYYNIAKYSGNPILTPNLTSPNENYRLESPSVLKDSDGYCYMAYRGMNGTGLASKGIIYIRKSRDCITGWTNLNESGILTANASNVWEADAGIGLGGTSLSKVIINGTNWYVIAYTAVDGVSGLYTVGMRKSQTLSPNPADWQYVQQNASFTTIDSAGTWDNENVFLPARIQYDIDSGRYVIYVTGNSVGQNRRIGCYMNSSNDISTWVECSGNPKIEPNGSSSWEDVHVDAPDVEKINDTYWIMEYTGETVGGSSSMGVAYTTNLTGTWTKDSNNPILLNGNLSEWDDSQVRYASIGNLNGTFIVYYTGQDGGTGKIGTARSPSTHCYPIWNATIANGTFYVRALTTSTNGWSNQSQAFQLTSSGDTTAPTIYINITPSYLVSPLESSEVVVTADMIITDDNYGSTLCNFYNDTGNNIVLTNSTPYVSTINATSKAVQCSISMRYYYLAGNYTINVNSTDTFNNVGIQNATFTYLNLDAFNLSTVTLNYYIAPNTSITNNFNVTNSGNYISTTQIKGTNLTNSSYSIDVSNLAWGLSPSPTTNMTTSFASIGTLQIQGIQTTYVKLFVPFGTQTAVYSGLIYLQSI